MSDWRSTKHGAPLGLKLERATELLARVEPELVPNHDAAQELADKFGLGRVSRTHLVEDIREFLAVIEGHPSGAGSFEEGSRA